MPPFSLDQDTSFVLFIGVDPGLGGGVAAVSRCRDRIYAFDAWSMPMEKIAGTRRMRRQVQAAGVVRIARELRDRFPSARLVAAVESVSAMPKQGVSSMFSFGDSFGCVRMLAALISEEVIMVTPRRWKNAMRLSKDKKQSLHLARRMFPALTSALVKEKDEGVAEALLLAFWAAKHVR